jgi:hypothetical protein
LTDRLGVWWNVHDSQNDALVVCQALGFVVDGVGIARDAGRELVGLPEHGKVALDGRGLAGDAAVPEDDGVALVVVTRDDASRVGEHGHDHWGLGNYIYLTMYLWLSRGKNNRIGFGQSIDKQE